MAAEDGPEDGETPVPWHRRGWRAKSLWIVAIIVVGHIVVVPITAGLVAWFVNR